MHHMFWKPLDKAIDCTYRTTESPAGFSSIHLFFFSANDLQNTENLSEMPAHAGPIDTEGLPGADLVQRM